MSDLLDLERRLRATLAALPPEARIYLLRVFELSSPARREIEAPEAGSPEVGGKEWLLRED